MVSNSNICSYLGLLLLLLLHTIDASDTSNTNNEDHIYDDVVPITATFRGPLDFDCTDGMCSYNNTNDNDCLDIFNNIDDVFNFIEYTDLSKTVTVLNMHGKYSIPIEQDIPFANATNKCILSCQKCSAIPYTEIDDFGCAGREKCCDTYAGFFYCHELGTCIDTTKQSCPINNGTAAVTMTYSGPTSLTCRNGGRCNIVSLVSGTDVDVDQCGLMTAGNRSLFGYYFISDLEGEYRVPEGCAVSCDDGCSPSSSLVVEGDTEATVPTGLLVLEPGPVILPSLATSDSPTSEGGPPTNVTNNDNNDTNTTHRRQLRGTIK